MHHPRRRDRIGSSSLMLAAVVAALTGCTAEAPDATPTPAPVLTFVDSIALADTGALALGDLANAGLHVGDGEIWVGDPRAGRMVRFDRRGRPLGTVGSKGRGPGELSITGPLTAMGDGGVAAWDYMAGKLVAYDIASGALRWETPLREMAFPLQLQAVGDTVWLGAVSVATNTGAMRIAPRDTQSRRFAPLPAEYVAGLARVYPYSVALRGDDALLVGYAGDHRLFVQHDDGRVDTLTVPGRRRRGVPPDILQQVMAQYGKPGAVASENLVSTLSRMAWLTGGSLALVHYDVSFDPGSGAPATTEVWLTVLDRDLSRACVDAPLTRAEPALPSMAFRGDTVFTLEQALQGEHAVPVLRSFAISTGGCAWMPVSR